LKAAWEAASKTAVRGPAEVKLLDEATLNLPPGEAFVPAAEADRIMQALGNGADPTRFGLIVSLEPGRHWDVLIRWIKEGYVRDGDAAEWQPDALLQSLREGTESKNAERIQRGLPALDIVGWVEPPVYDGSTHRLVWSLSARPRGASADLPQTINYNTYALGRDGFFSLNLLTKSAEVDADKPVVRGLLGSLTYLPGKRYEDFDESTDKVAAYGLAALIGVVAVKKLGLLALAGVFFLKAWKIGLIALLGLGAAFRRFRRRARPAAEP
jgi:uncharacterized membrane-anchored protein